MKHRHQMRRYAVWGGNPQGYPEDPARCIAGVWHEFAPGHPQCSFKRGKGPKGLYCGHHARQIKQGKHPYVPEAKRPKAGTGGCGHEHHTPPVDLEGLSTAWANVRNAYDVDDARGDLWIILDALPALLAEVRALRDLAAMRRWLDPEGA